MEALAARAGASFRTHLAQACVAEAAIGGDGVLLVKPRSFMNESGGPLARLLEAGGGRPEDLVVLVDDVALELGTIRVRPRGSDGGHNGLRSIAEALGTDGFARVRLGVRRGDLPAQLADYVLAEFPPEDALLLRDAVSLAADATQCLLREGVAEAMNRFNGRRP